MKSRILSAEDDSGSLWCALRGTGGHRLNNQCHNHHVKPTSGASSCPTSCARNSHDYWRARIIRDLEQVLRVTCMSCPARSLGRDLQYVGNAAQVDDLRKHLNQKTTQHTRSHDSLTQGSNQPRDLRNELKMKKERNSQQSHVPADPVPAPLDHVHLDLAKFK